MGKRAVRVVDPQFDRMTHDPRHDRIDAMLAQLPPDLEAYVVHVLALPADAGRRNRT